ncbi:MAG: methyltransferase domain-containing protein [Candidatus Micrarchaeota archaeon]
MSKKETWEKVWKNQRKNRGLFDRVLWKLRHSTSRNYAEKISKMLEGKPKPKILEVGCGSAVTFIYLRKKIPDAELVGLDFSPAALKLAEKRNKGCKFIEGDAKKMPFGSGKFDFVYSLGLIEHFSREVALQIVKEHARAAKEGGIVMIVVPAKYSLIHMARVVAGNKWPFGYEEAFGKQELLEVMRKAGLKHIRIERLKTIIYLATGMK